jgi:hypothetical protein
MDIRLVRGRYPSSSIAGGEVHAWSVTTDASWTESVRFAPSERASWRISPAGFEETAHALVRFILACYSTVDSSRIVLDAMTHQTHRMRDASGAWLHYSTAQAGTELLCTVALNREVGAGIEKFRPFNGNSSIYRQLPEAERELLNGMAPEDRAAALIRGLGRKQALANAQGLQLAVRVGEQTSRRALPSALFSPDAGRFELDGWTVEDLEALDSYSGSVAAQRSDWRLRTIQLKANLK